VDFVEIGTDAGDGLGAFAEVELRFGEEAAGEVVGSGKGEVGAVESVETAWGGPYMAFWLAIMAE
jgi:hypothetical protein